MTAFQPWSTPGCAAVVDGRLCGSEATVTLSRLGRRCAQHPVQLPAGAFVRDEWGARRVPERRTR